MAKFYSVGQINGYIKNLISSDYLLGDVHVKGEVSNCKYHSSGHIYFSLKDDTGNLTAVMFKGSVNQGLSFKLENGQLVVAHGTINVFERDGKYQLYVKDIKKDGLGNLYEEYERLKQKLFEEGLFDFEIKKTIPKFPRKVGIVTASTGAAICDIKNVAHRRNPYVQLYLYPAKVQGEGAAQDIVKGIKYLDSLGLDTIIIGRGGGSIEDLWAFNEEIVAYAIYEANTPIISGTGHEIDNTLADYAADLRAATPSAAAELAIPDVMSVIKDVNFLEEKITSLMSEKYETKNELIRVLERQIRQANPVDKIKRQQQNVDDIYKNITLLMDCKYKASLHKVAVLTEKINGLSPTAKLINGFGYLEIDGKAVLSSRAAKKGDKLLITVSDGQIHTVVEK